VHAEGGARNLGVVISPGLMAGKTTDGGWRFDGELSVTSYGDAWAFGGVIGGNPNRNARGSPVHAVG
jgi:hypothetical protein